MSAQQQKRSGKGGNRSGGAHRPTVAEARAAEQAKESQTKAARDAALSSRFAEGVPGRGLIAVDLGVTAVFAVLSLVAIGAYDTLATPVAIFDIAIFVVGLVAFAAALWLGASRSRDAEMDVAGWFFLSRIAPRDVQRRLMGALAIQVVIGIGAALASHGAAISAHDHASKLAFGTLVPIFGLALSGVWGARYGAFPPRRTPAPQAPPPRSRKRR